MPSKCRPALRFPGLLKSDPASSSVSLHYVFRSLGHGLERHETGDAIKVQAAHGEDGRTYEGFVHDVRLETIRVSFHGSFQAAGRRYNVCFQLNRTPLRRQHQALIASSPEPGRILFPTRGQEGLALPLGPNERPIDLYNFLIANNPAQLQAVKSIAHLRADAAPFIIFGP